MTRFSYIEGVRDTSPVVHELPWSELVELLSVYDIRAEKMAGPLFSPAELVGGRKSEHVQAIHFGVLDFDGVPLDAFLAALRAAEPYDSFAYTTWSQPESSQRNEISARLVVPFTRSVAPIEWPGVHARLVAQFGASADPACKDPTRCYFTPSLPIGAEWAGKTWRSPGAATGGLWDVDAALLSPMPVVAAPVEFVASDPVPRESLDVLARKLAKRTDPHAVRMGMLIKNGLDGHAIAQPGARDTTLFQVACTLAEAFPRGDAFSLAEHFRLSLGIMAQQAPDCPTLENVAEKIARAQKKIAADQADLAKTAARSHSIKISIAFHGERATPYTPTELEAFGDMTNRWLVQRGKQVYIFFAGSYVGPFIGPELPAACSQFLAPATTAGIELFTTNDKGVVEFKDLTTLMLQYGRVVERVDADMTAPRTYLAAGRHVLVEAPCPVRGDLEPTFDPEVAAWLELLAGGAGGKIEALKDWIASVTWLKYPSPALYLKGEPGTGKSLLAFGLARIWKANHPTTLRSAMGTFNAEIARCPLVLADEKIPESWHGAPRTEELRELITTTEFSLNRKFQDLVTCTGSLRVMLCANNLRLISSKEDLTPEDAKALADRFLFVTPHPAAREWLAERGGQTFTESFVEGDRIARHALWLRDTQQVQRGGRLVVPGNADELLRMIQVGNGLRWSIFYWLDSFIHNQAPHVAARAGRPFAALVRDGLVWIAPRLLVESWSHYLEGERPPTQERLAMALRGLTLPTRTHRYEPRDARANGARYLAIDTSHLVAWYEAVAGEVPSDLAECLSVNTESLGVPGMPHVRPN